MHFPFRGMFWINQNDAKIQWSDNANVELLVRQGGNLFLVLRNVNHGKMTDSRLRINRDVETEKAVQSQVWSRSIKIWSYGGGENNKQQPLAVPARETRCRDSHISLGPVTWPTDTSRVRALTRILSVNTPSLYLSPTMGDEHPDGDISLSVIFLPPALTSLLSARHRPSTDHGRGRLRTQENNAVRVSVVTRTRVVTPQ